MSNRPSTAPALLRASTYGPRGRGRILNFLLVLLLLPLTAAGIVATASPASAAAAVSGVVDPLNGFPLWYEDAAGGRVEQCLNAADVNCPPLLAAPGAFDPAQPVVFPTNFPPEMFYAVADASIPTAGCAASGVAAGNMTMRIALEGAFLGGNPSPTDRMTFGRIRVKGTGLCPNTTYTFQEPFGTLVLPTNDLGIVIATVGTTNIGCVPVPGSPCDFSLATGSPIFGTAANGGFLKWDTGAPAGYLGDPAVAHTITGGTNGNVFTIEDPTGENAASTSQFFVAGKIAGSLQASPSPADLGGVVDGTTSAPVTVTVTNVDTASVTLGTPTFSGGAAADFATAATGTCTVGTVLTRDQTCTYDVTLTPPAATPPGPLSATLQVPSTGGVRSPLSVVLNGSAKALGQAPVISLNAASVDFGNVRVRETSPTKHIIITNSGTAALTVTDVLFDQNTVPEYDNYRMILNTCTTINGSIAPGGTCTIDLQMAPLVAGVHPTAVIVRSNNAGGEVSVPVTGTGFGGLADVAKTFTTLNDGFPDWYMDDQGAKVGQCTNPADPYCVVLPDAFYNPALPIAFPTNWPVEFFYHVATSDNIAIGDATCGAGVGKAFMRSAIEGAFPPAGPAVGTQLVFGRIRFFVSGGGLCPNTDYVFEHPYGSDRFTIDAAGGLRRKDATDDVGCLIGAVGTCDFTRALSSRVLGSTLRWDPATLPAAPAGYQGDAKTLHKVVGAAYSPVAGSPANYFEIKRADDGLVVGKTDLFTVMGKYLGPLEASPAGINFGVIPQGSTSGTVSSVITNTGINPVIINTVTTTGVDAAAFTVSGGDCVGATLAPNAKCTVSASVSPTAAGALSAQLLLNNDSYNATVAVPLTAIGGAPGATANVSFSPRSIAFGSLHDGQASEVETLTVSNAGGAVPLTIHTVAITGANAADFHVVKNNCPTDAAPADIAIGGTCTVDVAFAASAPGARSGALTITSNAPGGTSSAALTGTGVAAGPAVAAALDPRNGFPAWFQDGNGNRVEPCLENTGKCILLADAGYNPNLPISFPTNFPAEFFYSIADSEQIVTPGCPAAGIPAGTAILRMAIEGSFANGTPIAGDQITFARQRVTVRGGLCPNAPYTFVSPWGPFTVNTDATGGIKPTAGTVDNTAVTTAAMANGFARWNPNTGTIAPTAGYLGDPATLHAIQGGTYVPAGSGGAQQSFIIQDSAGNEVAKTSNFFVAGKLAGPLQSSSYTLDFLHVNQGVQSASKQVTVTNVGAPATITARTVAGLNPGDYTVTGGTCIVGLALGTDQTCTLQVAFLPTTTGTRAAQVRLTPTVGGVAGADLVVNVTGIGDLVGTPASTATPGTLAFGTRNAGTNTTLTTVIKNTGTAPLNVSNVAISGAQAGDFTRVTAAATPCPAGVSFTLAANTSCTLAVSFSPKGSGARAASLVVTHNASPTTTTISLSGTGVTSSFSMAPSPIGFSSVTINTTKAQSVSVKNTGALSFTLTSASFVTAAPAGTFTVTGPGCLNTVLATGKSCNITVSFRPTQRIAYTGTLQVFGDSSTIPSPVSVALSGTGK